jgi:hypothetical protein
MENENQKMLTITPEMLESTLVTEASEIEQPRINIFVK